MRDPFPHSLITLLSVDIVSSAEFKAQASKRGGAEAWVRAFESFFTVIPKILNDELNSLETALETANPVLPDVQIWKAIGDQLVFLSRPTTPLALENVCLAFLRTIRKASQHMQHQWGFLLHGVIWAFEENAENVTFQFGSQHLNGSLGFDLIGPDVDLGFRLMGLAPPEQVLVPLEMRGLLPLQWLQLEMIGEAALKGIPLNPYPLLKIEEIQTAQ